MKPIEYKTTASFLIPILQAADSRGTNYRDLVENTRKNLAFKYIHEPDLSLGEISYLLGFSTHSNFNRAFKRWSEFSPNLYRNRVVFQPFIESKH